MTEDLQRTPLFDAHKALGARLVPFAGWHMPVQYTGIVEEHHAVRKHAGLFDVSHMGQLRLEGSAAGQVLDSLVTGNLDKLEVGRALYTLACNAEGGILDDLIVYRLQEAKWLVVCNASRHFVIAPYVEKAAAGRCEFVDVSRQRALLAIQGPNAARILQALHVELAGSLKRFSVSEAQICGADTLLARTGYTGEDGFEISCLAEAAAHIWQELLRVGQTDGLRPIGLGARDTLRLEAALSLYGNEIDETTHPFEAGLAWVVHKNKNAYVGQSTLETLRTKPLTRKLVGLEMVDRAIARHGYAVVDAQGTPIGIVTSGSPAPTLEKNIALAYVPFTSSALGSNVVVDVRGKKATAKVVATPFYKRAT